MSKPHGVELPSRVLLMCHEPALLYVMQHYHEEK